MAHFILEYSANLTEQELKLNALFTALHDAALATEIFPLAGIRSRAHRCNAFRVADGTQDFAFIHLNVRIGAGRSDEDKQRAASALFDVLKAHLEDLFNQRGLAVSFELTELPETLKFNLNNLRSYLAEKR